MPCLAQEYHTKLPTAGHYCKSLSSLVRETYAHCHVPCVRIPGGAGWSSGEDSDDDSEILNEMRNRQLKKRYSFTVDSPSPRLTTAAFAWSCRVRRSASWWRKMRTERRKRRRRGLTMTTADDDDGDDYCDADDESEAFYSVKSFFTRSTSRGATVASSVCGLDLPPPLLRSPEKWEGFRDCEGWPFGLCRRPAVLPLPPLPATPADSWKWRKSVSSLAGSPAPAYSYRTASST
ncbi:hypothetical protein EJB05_35801, partial [Eragrostis curvula]